MESFSIKECRVLWDKRKKILKKAKPAIRKDLLGMSDIIKEAMDYTKDKALKKRETQIVYWLNHFSNYFWMSTLSQKRFGLLKEESDSIYPHRRFKANGISILLYEKFYKMVNLFDKGS